MTISSHWHHRGSALIAIVTILLIIRHMVTSGNGGDEGEITPSPTASPARPPGIERVLCYGDSLTAGASDTNHQYPYANYLQIKLPHVNVTHRGNPGWTTQKMLDDLNTVDWGLLTAMPADVVILLVGTNDLVLNDSAETVSLRILKLHQQALQAGARHTIAIDIPQSEWQLDTPAINALAIGINNKIHALTNTSKTTSWAKFPFDLNHGRMEGYYHADGTHLTEKGYKVLGEYLAPLVNYTLSELGRSS